MRDNVAMPPITAEQLAALPSEFRAVVQALIDHYEGQLVVLRAENETLRAELAQAKKNSRNSSQPPSSEHPHSKPPPPAKLKSQRPRGGQPGHEKHERALIAVEECAAEHDHRPRNAEVAAADCAVGIPRRCGIRSGSCPRSSRWLPSIAVNA